MSRSVLNILEELDNIKINLNNINVEIKGIISDNEPVTEGD